MTARRLCARLVVWVAFALTIVFARTAEAHKPSDSYLTLTVRGARVDGRWDIALRDLDYGMGLDRDHDGKITMAELAEIAKVKMPDLNAGSLEAAVRSIAGSARSMGVEVVD